MKFTKMQGIGNDYVYVNCFEETIENPKDLAIAVSDRHFGIGGDGLILICPSTKADAKMEMYNADGSLAEMCGNGVRCVAKYVYEHKIARKETLSIETGNGVLPIDLVLKNGMVEKARVNMGKPILKGLDIPSTFDKKSVVSENIKAGDKNFQISLVSLGNPHCVIFLEINPNSFDVHHYGPLIENQSVFPNKINVEFVKVISKTEVIQRTWERGSGETLACGTGASAVCVAGVLNGYTKRKILNHLKGGDLELDWEEDGPVFMTGPAVEVFSGEWIRDKG